MDIEQIKKINAMSKTLQKHGIAETSEDASKIASKMEGVSLEKKSSEQIEILLERQARKFHYAIEEMSKKIAELEKKVSNQISIREVSHKEATNNKPKKEETMSQLRADPNILNPDDFSVEKMFYYGNK